jgi:galactan endo-1,6-beta-galactosidase
MMMYGQVGAVGLLSLLSFAAASETITISATTSWGTWDGWGVSLAWWATRFGTRDDLADIFFTTKTTTLNGVSLPGLGFNIARYNAGACSKNKLADGAVMVESPNIISTHQLDGFWLNPTSTSPTCKSGA